MNIWLLWILWSILLLIILFFALPSILPFINKRTRLLREFIMENDGFFTLAFIFLFAGEQVALLIFITFFEFTLTQLKFVIGIFALVVIVTASLQIFIVETKRKYEREVRLSLQESNRVLGDYKSKIDNILKKFVTKKL